MDKDELQTYLDEFYLLEKKAQERLVQLEAHSDRKLASMENQEVSLEKLVSNQKSCLRRLERYLCKTHSFYEKMVKWGSVLASVIALGILCLFLEWWHVDTMLKEDQFLKAYVKEQWERFPEVENQEGHTYVRVVPGARVPRLTGRNGERLKGEYAEVYLNTK